MDETWSEFFERLDAANAVPTDFMDSRPMNALAEEKGLFDDELVLLSKIPDAPPEVS